MAALEVVKVGCRWRIGTGHLVNIWKNPWLPRTPSFRIITPNPHDDRVVSMHDLILHNSREWNMRVLIAFFWPIDRDLICQIPFSLFGSSDFLVWHYSSNGLYSVRSAYHSALSLAFPAGTSGEDRSRNLCGQLETSFALRNSGWIHSKLPFRFYYAESYTYEQHLWVSDFVASPLPADNIKINFEGSVRNGGRALGLEVVARDAAGECLAWISSRLDRKGSTQMAETLAAWKPFVLRCGITGVG
ncbi:UNVERIFIED_CONTAM: hypothetical protein Sradi_6219700 [Sesamum radiatum]|uniref:Uncharacterized protein n=1 Tax=Sesamum radiatum TaxID=300843 RepID=A0AAW2KAJ4_SESRA